MTKPKGGRGYKAPYETRQVRIPEPIIKQVDNLIERYQYYLSTGGDPNNPPQLLDIDRSDELENLKTDIQNLQRKVVQLKDKHQKAFKLVQYAVTPPNGTNKGEKGYQAKSFSKGLEDIKQALALLD